MESNTEIAAQFDDIAELLDLDQANQYRVQAYRQVARQLRDETRDIALLVKRGEDITAIPGIGENSAAVIRELVLTGSSHYFDKIRMQTPAILRRLLQVPGLGPVRIKQLYFSRGIRTLAQLKQVAQKGELRNLPGFGERLEQRIVRYFAGEKSSTRMRQS